MTHFHPVITQINTLLHVPFLLDCVSTLITGSTYIEQIQSPTHTYESRCSTFCKTHITNELKNWHHIYFFFIPRSVFKKFPKLKKKKKKIGIWFYPCLNVQLLRVPTQLVPLDGASLNLWGTTQLSEGVFRAFMHKAWRPWTNGRAGVTLGLRMIRNWRITRVRLMQWCANPVS